MMSLTNLDHQNVSMWRIYVRIGETVLVEQFTDPLEAWREWEHMPSGVRRAMRAPGMDEPILI